MIAVVKIERDVVRFSSRQIQITHVHIAWQHSRIERFSIFVYLTFRATRRVAWHSDSPRARSGKEIR